MSKKFKAELPARQFEAEQKMRRRRCRIRRLAIERLRWIKVSTGDTPAEAKDQRLHEIEITQRQVKAGMWRETPDCTRWEGTGRDRRKLDKDADRWAGLWQLIHAADKLVQAVMERRHGPVPTFQEDPDAKHYGPFDIELDDLDSILEDDIHLTIQRLSARHERMHKPATYRPDGSIASTPAVPPVLLAPVSPHTSTRPTPPPIPPVVLDVAEEFEIPFGKHRGDSIGYLLGDRETIGYLQWLCTKAEIKSPKFAEALQVVYDHYQGEIDSRTPPEEASVRYVPKPAPAAPPTPPPPYEDFDEDDIPF